MAGIKILGHSVHPIMIVFPLGLLSTAAIFDLVHLITGDPVFYATAYWMIAAGLIGGAAAAVFGWLDWLTIPAGTRARSIGLIHGGINSGVIVLSLVNLIIRTTMNGVETMAAVLSWIGFVLAFAGGWFGGELVERLGIAVHPGANPNAPSSLVTDDATANVGEAGEFKMQSK